MAWCFLAAGQHVELCCNNLALSAPPFAPHAANPTNPSNPTTNQLLSIPPTRQIPDVDLVLHTADFACVKKSWDHGGGPPLPMLGLQGSSRHYDLPFPE